MASSDDRRWEINLMTDEGQLGDVTVVKDTKISISEVDYDVSIREKIRYYDKDDNELKDLKRARIKATGIKATEGGISIDINKLIDFFDEENSFTKREYDSKRHEAIMAMLNEFTPEQELLDYNPEL